MTEPIDRKTLRMALSTQMEAERLYKEAGLEGYLKTIEKANQEKENKMTEYFKQIWLGAYQHADEYNDIEMAKACLNYWPSVACEELEKYYKDLKQWIEKVDKKG